MIDKEEYEKSARQLREEIFSAIRQFEERANGLAVVDRLDIERRMMIGGQSSVLADVQANIRLV